jgi:hypothetical protein
MYRRDGEKGDIDWILHEFQIVDEVILCPMLDRAYVIVADYAVALADQDHHPGPTGYGDWPGGGNVAAT